MTPTAIVTLFATMTVLALIPGVSVMTVTAAVFIARLGYALAAERLCGVLPGNRQATINRLAGAIMIIAGVATILNA